MIFVQFYEPKELVNIVIQEDADIVGISFITGSHLPMVEGIFRSMTDRQIDVPVVLGGIIPIQEHQTLKEMGVHEVFSAGSSIDDIIECFRALE